MITVALSLFISMVPTLGLFENALLSALAFVRSLSSAIFNRIIFRCSIRVIEPPISLLFGLDQNDTDGFLHLVLELPVFFC